MTAGGRTRSLLPLLFLFSAILACGPEKPEVAPEMGEQVAEIAKPAAAELLRTLVASLTSAMEEEGPEAALEFCSNEAIPLTRMVEAGLAQPLNLKRTSFRYRNPENAPDEAEEEALLFFERAILDGGTPSSSYVQRVSDEEYRYYQPLFLGEVCLRCHGNPETMDPGVRRALAQRYPEDLATGYVAGDFRGLVRVAVPAEILDGGGA